MGRRHKGKKPRVRNSRGTYLYSIGLGEIGAAAHDPENDPLPAHIPLNDSWGRPARLSGSSNQALRLPHSAMNMESLETRSPFIAPSHGRDHLITNNQPRVPPTFGNMNRSYVNQPEKPYQPNVPDHNLLQRGNGTTLGVGNVNRSEEPYRPTLASLGLLESNGSAIGVANTHSFGMSSTQPSVTSVLHFESAGNHVGIGSYMGNQQEQRSTVPAQAFVSNGVSNQGLVPGNLYESHLASNESFLPPRNKERRAPQKLSDWARPPNANPRMPGQIAPSSFSSAPIWSYDLLRDSSPRDVQRRDGNF